METPFQIIESYVKKYNAARNSKDLPNAIKWGKYAVRDASEELKKNSAVDPNRSYYMSVVRTINEFLANPEMAIKATATATNSGGDDKISTTDWFAAPIPNLSLQDIAGLKEVKNQLIVNAFAPTHPLYAPIYEKYRGKERGAQLLFYGPPGTGKTFTVKCLAGQMKCKIAVVQIKDVMANLVGDGAKIISEIFRQASQHDRCIIFFDEIDAIASSREGDDSRHTKEQLTTLLTNMDGFTSNTKPGQIRIVIAATNRPWALDSAVKRGGRFDRQIYIPLPDKEARKTLIERALGKDRRVKDRVDVPCAEDVNINWLVERFEGFSGADITSVCRQAVTRPMEREIYALSQGITKPDKLTRGDFEAVLSRYINSITDEMLLAFDAYSMNMSYGSEYVKTKSEQVIKDLFNSLDVEPFIMRWFKELCECGYVWKHYHKKYDLSFLKEKYALRLMEGE